MTQAPTRKLLILLALAAAVLAPNTADAFCGFYVSGGGADAFNNATQVVLMRDGTRTTLSMQNNYEGPLAEFAMVVPVPVVLMVDDVKTLDKSLFDKIDQLSAPRLVEYWEDDPCHRPEDDNNGSGDYGNNGGGNNGDVVVEAEFKVGEYEISILSASDSGALSGWLESNDYNIPDRAEAHLQPYIDAGQYFFVAKVIASEVRYEDGRAVLSPLRFSYNSEEFSLPIRLGLISAEDEQDLIVQILARDQRYEAANYDNVTIPTNIDVRDGVRHEFGAFYNALFTRTLEENPGAVVTEYAWSATQCDPCPLSGVLEPGDLASLGADLLQPGASLDNSWVLTRLHARYAADSVGEDIVLRAAEPIAGGREFTVRYDPSDGRGESGPELGSFPNRYNAFQGRYAIRNLWEGPVACEVARYGQWVGNPDPNAREEPTLASSPNTSGEDFRTQQAELETYLAGPIPDRDSAKGTGGCAVAGPTTFAPLAVLGLFLLRLRRG